MSDYPAFEMKIDNDDGTFTPVPSQTVFVYNVTDDAPLSDTASDANGQVPSATVAVDAGTLLRFSFMLDTGVCGFSEVLTV